MTVEVDDVEDESGLDNESARASIHPGPDDVQRRGFLERLWDAMKLDADLYEEVEHDPSSLIQAAGVVALAALASSIGFLGVLGPSALLSGLVSAFVSWLVWTTVVWIVGVKAFGYTSDFEELLRTLGFVAAPQILYLLLVVRSGLWQSAVALVVIVMTVIAFVRATRHALDIDNTRALGVGALCVVLHLLLGATFLAIARLT